VCESSLGVVNVMHIENEAKVTGVEAVVGLELVQECGLLLRLNLLVDSLIGELSIECACGLGTSDASMPEHQVNWSG
jgi:hypothetical protein